MFHDAFFYAAANYIAQGIGILNSFLLRAFLGPAAIGIWSVLQVILGYCGYASLGTTRALGRDYPIFRGKGDFEKAELVKNSTLTFSMLMSLIPFAGILLSALYLHQKWERPFIWGMLFLAFFLFIQRYYDFIITLLRSEKKFKILSIQIVLNAIGGILVTSLLVQHWKIYGLFLGTALLTLCLILYLQFVHPYRFKIEIHKKTLIHELTMGLPLIASAFLYTFLAGLDRLIIAKKLGFYEAGLYSIAIMVSNYILSLPMMMSHIIFPNLLEAYGENNENRLKVIHFLKRPAFFLSVLNPFLCSMAFAGAPLLVELFLKKYVLGLSCMKIYLVGTFFLMMGQLSNSFLIAIDRYLKMIPILLVTIALNLGLCLLFIHWHWGIQGVALGTVISYTVYGIGTYILSFWETHGNVEGLKSPLEDLFIFTGYFTLIFLCDRWIQTPSLWLTAITKLGAFLFLSLPFWILVEKRENFFKTLLQKFQQRFAR